MRGDYRVPRSLIGSLALALVLWAALATLALAAEFGPYRAQVLRVIDGDTLELRVEIWPRQSVLTVVRLAGVNAPEISSGSDCERRAGRAAAEFARRWVAEHRTLQLILTGRDKYGRDLGRIVSGEADLAQALVVAGHARAYDGGKREAWC